MAFAVTTPPKRVRFLDIFGACAKIGLTSFGGGMSGWMYRDFVERRKWLTDEEFLSSLAMCQAMPGVNVVNMAIWVGFRLRGTPGALAGFVAIVFPPLVVILILGAMYGRFQHVAALNHALAGIAAAAIALNVNLGFRAARVAARNIVAVAILVVLFVAIGIAQLPMLPLVLVLAPISIALAYFQERKR
jgi:chromate transporter